MRDPAPSSESLQCEFLVLDGTGGLTMVVARAGGGSGPVLGQFWCKFLFSRALSRAGDSGAPGATSWPVWPGRGNAPRAITFSGSETN